MNIDEHGSKDYETCEEDLPGNSVSDVGERMKGGAVSEERSPEKEAMLSLNENRVNKGEIKCIRFEK
jgi:hypothetical protein